MNNTFTYHDLNKKPHIVRLQGHRLLVRRCVEDDTRWLVGEVKQAADDFAQRMLDSWRSAGVVGAPWWAHVLALGPDVGQLRPVKWFKQYGVPYVNVNAVANLRVNDRVLLPPVALNGLMYGYVTPPRHEMWDCDYIVDECIVQCVYRDTHSTSQPVAGDSP